LSEGLAPGGPDAGDVAPFTPYQRRLFAFLGVACFFEGYDFIALTQVLPNLRAAFGMDKTEAGLLVTFINLGTVVAYLVVRSADRIGRRRVLTLTIAGYTLATFASGLAPGPLSFGLFQAVARVFLIGEYATSMVIAAEEFPARRRGLVIGVIAGFSSLGAIVCAGVVPLLLRAPWGFRTVYLVAILPLGLVAWARRGLRETQRFEELAAEPPRPLGEVLRTPYRRRILQLGAVWFVAYVATQNTVTFWKDFAVTERGFGDADVARAVTRAALVATPLAFLAGKLSDVVGRRPAAALVLSAGALGTWGCYSTGSELVLTAGLVLGIFSASAMPTVLNTFTAELFPTRLRGDGFAWSNNLLGRLGYVLSPAVVGLAASRVGWGAAVRATAVFPLVAVVLVYLFLPETRGRSLEETSALPSGPPRA